MCRTGGRRCPSSGGRGKSGGGDTPAADWGEGHVRDADREAYEQRAQEVRDRAAAGERIDDILAAKHAETSMSLLERALRLDREDRGAT